MDENGPAARMERTLWTVWCYISEAVNRFLRPQPDEPVSCDPNSPDESGADGEPPDCGPSQDDIVNSSEKEGIDEEQPDATVSLLSMSSPTVAWAACTKDSKSDEEEAAQLRKGNESKESEDERRTGEEGLDHDELLDAEEEKANQVEQEDTEIKRFSSCEQSGMSKHEEESTDVGSVGLTSETVCKVVEKSDEKGGGDEESKTQDYCQKVDEATTETQKTEDDVEEDLEDEEKLCKAEESVATDDVAPTFRMKDANICEGVLQLSSETENTSEERRKQADSQLAVCEELSEDELIVPEQEIGGKNDIKILVTAAEEEDISDTAQKLSEDEEPETEKDNKTVQDGHQEGNVLTKSVTFSEAAEVTHKEEDVVVIVETTEADVATAETDLSSLEKDQVGKERPTSEVDNKASCVENICTLVTVKPETAQEASREFKNIPQRLSEGQATVSHEPSTEASEETREGVPEHNNELESDENKTQGFLEGGNCGEIHNIPLPEEVEDEERASLINSGTGADYLLEGELLEETQDSTDLSNNKFDLTEEELTESQPSAQDTEKPQSGKENLESELLFEEEVELLDSSMKTKFKLLGKELETYDETDKTTEELQYGVNAPEFGTDGEPVSAKEAAEDGDERNEGVAVDKEVEFDEGTPKTQAIPEPSLCLDSAQSANTNQTSEGTYNLEDTADLMMGMEIELSDDNIKVLHVDTEEEDSSAEEEEDNKMQDINQTTTLQLAETTEELIQTQNDKVNALITESEVSPHSERHTMINQSPLRALQTQEINTTDTEAASEAKITEGRNNLEMPAEETKEEERYTEEMSSSVTGHPDVIPEEILDLWMKTAMSKDTDNDEEDWFELQKDTTEHQLKEESGEHSPEGEKQLLMEPHSVEPTAVSDSESLSEPGYLEQTQQLKPTTSLEDVHNKLVTTSQSAGSSEFSALDSESQAELMEETAETAEPGRVTEYCSDSGLSSSEEKLNEGSERSLEELDENSPETEAEVETGTTAWKETEKADVTSLINVHFQDETRVEDEPVKDVLFEEDFISTEPASGGEQWIESEENQTSLDHRCSEEIPESLLRLSRAEVAEKQAVMLEDQDEVDALLLDSRIQRSRISVKNPRVRPPTDPRSLIHMPSAEPTPSSHVPVKLPGVPLGGMGMGIKLPGLGGGFPVLKKTQKPMRGEDSQSIKSQEPEKKVEEESEGDKQDETQHKPKWMPPGHAGFGNPLMSELRTKLKKTAKE